MPYISLNFPDNNNSARYNASKPSYSTLEYDKQLVFANRNLLLDLEGIDYGIARFRISWSGDVDYGSICFYDGNGSIVSVSDDIDGLYKVCFAPDMYIENIFRNEENNTQNKEFFVVVNGDKAQTTDTLNIVVSVASKNPTNATVNILYDCPGERPIYEYETGMHVYSPYDARAGQSVLTTKLYSRVPISNWTSGTKIGILPRFNNTHIWQSSTLSSPAMPYYYGHGENIYQVGQQVNREYGTKLQYVMHKPRYSFKKSFREETVGPQRFYDSVNETSQACITPTMQGVGKLSKIQLTSSLNEPEQYRYYMGFDYNNKRNSNDSVFTKYSFSDTKHHPITGFQHATEKMVSAIFTGYNRNLKPLFIGAAALGIAGLAALIPSVTSAISSAAFGIQMFFSGLIGPFSPALLSLGSSIGGAMASIMAVAPYVLLAAALIYLAIKFFSSVTKYFKEDCKEFLHHFTDAPYINTGSILYRDEDLSIVNDGYFCDGVYYYDQFGGSVTNKELSFTDAIVNEDPKEFKFLYSVQADDPTLVEDLSKLILLPYASGKPMPYCGGDVIYESSYKSETITTECCDFETCDPVVIEVPYGMFHSCVSQQDADDQAEEQLEQAVGFARAQGTYITSTESPTDFLAHFTHEIRVEDRPTETGVFYTGSIGIGNSLYYDAFGCHKVLDGYYTTSSAAFYKEFYHTTNGEIDDIQYIVNQGDSYTQGGMPVDYTNLDFTSNWFLSGSSKNTLDTYPNQNWFWNRLFDTTEIKGNTHPYQAVTGYIVSSSYQDFKIYPNFTDTSSTLPATPGYYKPLIDWFYQDSFYFDYPNTVIDLTPKDDCDFDLNTTQRRFSINSTSGSDNKPYPASTDVEVNYTVYYTSSTYNFNNPSTILPQTGVSDQVNIIGAQLSGNTTYNILPISNSIFTSVNPNSDCYRANALRKNSGGYIDPPIGETWLTHNQNIGPAGASGNGTAGVDVLAVSSSRIWSFGSGYTEADSSECNNNPRQAAYDRFFYSDDMGDTWNQVAGGPGYLTFGLPTKNSAWIDGDYIVVTTEEIIGSTFSFYWVSDDGGSTFNYKTPTSSSSAPNANGINYGIISKGGQWYMSNSKGGLLTTTSPEDSTTWTYASNAPKSLGNLGTLLLTNTHLFCLTADSATGTPQILTRFDIDSNGNISNRIQVTIVNQSGASLGSIFGNDAGSIDTIINHQWCPNPSELLITSAAPGGASPYVSYDNGLTWTQTTYGNLGNISNSPNPGTLNYPLPNSGTNGEGVLMGQNNRALRGGFDPILERYLYPHRNTNLANARGNMHIQVQGFKDKVFNERISGSYSGSLFLDPTLSENYIDYANFIDGLSSTNVVLEITGSNPILNFEYSSSDHILCNQDDDILCSTRFIGESSTPTKSFPRIQHVEISEVMSGSFRTFITSSTQPVKYTLEYDGTEILDTGYLGDTNFQSQLDDALALRGLPNETMVGTRFFDTNLIKTKAIPSGVTASFYAPIEDAFWKYEVVCIADTIILLRIDENCDYALSSFYITSINQAFNLTPVRTALTVDFEVFYTGSTGFVTPQAGAAIGVNTSYAYDPLIAQSGPWGDFGVFGGNYYYSPFQTSSGNYGLIRNTSPVDSPFSSNYADFSSIVLQYPNYSYNYAMHQWGDDLWSFTHDGYFKSTDGGLTWENKATSSVQFPAPYSYASNDDLLGTMTGENSSWQSDDGLEIMVGTRSVNVTRYYYSKNGGDSWEGEHYNPGIGVQYGEYFVPYKDISNTSWVYPSQGGNDGISVTAPVYHKGYWYLVLSAASTNTGEVFTTGGRWALAYTTNPDDSSSWLRVPITSSASNTPQIFLMYKTDKYLILPENAGYYHRFEFQSDGSISMDHHEIIDWNNNNGDPGHMITGLPSADGISFPNQFSPTKICANSRGITHQNNRYFPNPDEFILINGEDTYKNGVVISRDIPNSFQKPMDTWKSASVSFDQLGLGDTEIRVPTPQHPNFSSGTNEIIWGKGQGQLQVATFVSESRAYIWDGGQGHNGYFYALTSNGLSSGDIITTTSSYTSSFTLNPSQSQNEVGFSSVIQPTSGNEINNIKINNITSTTPSGSFIYVISGSNDWVEC